MFWKSRASNYRPLHQFLGQRTASITHAGGVPSSQLHPPGPQAGRGGEQSRGWVKEQRGAVSCSLMLFKWHLSPLHPPHHLTLQSGRLRRGQASRPPSASTGTCDEVPCRFLTQAAPRDAGLSPPLGVFIPWSQVATCLPVRFWGHPC